MNARFFNAIAFLIIFSIIFWGCKSDTVTNSAGITSLDTASFRYPFKIGNSWSYTLKTYASDIHPDSILKYFSNYPLTSNGTVTILYDTSINGIQTRCFLDVLSNGQGTYQSRNYLINNDTSLLIYAHRGFTFFGGPPNDVPVIKKYSLESIIDETIYICDPPVSILIYPVVTGRTWGTPDTVVKKYEGYELITISAGMFKCMKKSTIYAILPESPYYDYYCKYGLLKRTVTFNDMIITNEWNPEGMGTADLTYITSVNSFNIP
jgi:hypothetical protein